MLPRMSSLSFYLVTLFILVASKSWTATSILTRNKQNDCNDKANYFNLYDEEIIPGFKVLDGLRAQDNYIRKSGILPMFQPSIAIPGRHSFDREVVDAIKSLIELIRLKKRHQLLSEGSQDPKLVLVQVLLTKVAQDACHWVNESKDITITDCTNIDLSQLEEVHSRLILYNTLVDSYGVVNKVMGVGSHAIHQCAWVNDRILGKCATSPNTIHRDDLNQFLCDPNSKKTTIRNCDPQLCQYQQ